MSEIGRSNIPKKQHSKKFMIFTVIKKACSSDEGAIFLFL
jgi:hypothetical protein